MAVYKMTIVSSFTYRGAAEEYSNTYHISGTLPADQAAWQALGALFVTAQKITLPSSVTITHWYGYSDPDANASHSGIFSSSNVGTLTTTGGTVGPGDSAVWMRWDTHDLSSTGKKIYLRKYLHPAVLTTGAPDTVLAAQKTALETSAAGLVDGSFLPGGGKLCRPNGHVGYEVKGSTYVTTRTLKRRGKRPSS